MKKSGLINQVKVWIYLNRRKETVWNSSSFVSTRFFRKIEVDKTKIYECERFTFGQCKGQFLGED